MLGLNLASSFDSTSLEAKSGRGQRHDSVTTESSVLDAEDCRSTRPAAAYEFSLLKGYVSAEGENGDGIGAPQQPGLVTKQLFQLEPLPLWMDLTPHQPPTKKSRRGPLSRSSQYRGVTFYRRTGRWESHIWTYDRAAIRFRGVDADLNFNLNDYEEDLKQESQSWPKKEANGAFPLPPFSSAASSGFSTTEATAALPPLHAPPSATHRLHELHHITVSGTQIIRAQMELQCGL
ncbi:hypothetical protein BHE74_00037283 [Ensete ventricosum]|nr:hypothetical protein BHE74_00037283 [Ensete ventricosum]